MADWSGSGLPPAALRRIEKSASSDMRSSLLSVPSAVGAESAGFEPIGEVMGCVVVSLSGAMMPNCGYYGMGGFGYAMNPGTAQVFLADAATPTGRQGYEPYVDVINRGWALAMSRLLIEATELHSDGVVGITLSQQRFEGGAMEFMALGTAVRATTPTSPQRHAAPFTTHLGGTDLAKLTQMGYSAVHLAIDVSLAIRHDDYSTLMAQSMYASNVELTGYSELVTAARAGVRNRLTRQLARGGATGAVIESLQTRIFSYEPFENHSDHLVEARIVATTIKQGSQRELPRSPQGILSLLDPPGYQ